MPDNVTPENPVPDRYGFVILVDALGTKGATTFLQPQQIADRWQEFLEKIEEWTGQLNDKPNIQTKIAHSIPFSDTAYICIESSRETHLVDVIMLDEFATILHDAIGAGVFLRGAISYGLYYHKNTQVFGPAIEEAAAWYEEADWIGVCATPSVSHILDIVKNDSRLPKSQSFVNYPVPFKSKALNADKMDSWALGWPSCAPNKLQVYSNIRSAFIEYGGIVPPIVLPKYLNTLAFIDNVLDVEAPHQASMAHSSIKTIDVSTSSDSEISVLSGGTSRSSNPLADQ